MRRLQRHPAVHPLIIATSPTFFEPITHRLIEDAASVLISMRYNSDDDIGMHCVKKSASGKVVGEYCVCKLENNEFAIVEQAKREVESSPTGNNKNKNKNRVQPKVSLEMSEDAPTRTGTKSKSESKSSEEVVKPVIYMDDDDVEFEDLDSDDPDDDLDL